MKKFLLGLVMTVLFIGTAHAQQRAALAIITEELDKAAAVCGISDEAIRKEAAQILRKNNIRVVNESDIFLYVNMNVVYEEKNKLCAASYNTSIVTIGEEKRYGAFKSRTVPMIHLCDSGGLTVFQKGEPIKNVLSDVSENIEACLADTQF